MTTRTRRTKQTQARDILLALLKDQEAEAAKHKTRYEGANLRVASTRRAIELLDQAVLPGMEPLEEKLQDPSEPIPSPYTTSITAATLLTPRPHRQRIGAKAQDSPTCPECKHELPWHYEGCTVLVTTKEAKGITDVWSADDPPGTTVHTALMNSRQESCELCRAGVPFASVARTEHYIVNNDQGSTDWLTFDHKPCTGI